MNVGKIAQFAMDGLKAVKSMPLAGKVAVGALFGVAGLTGVLIGDAFEKEPKKEIPTEQPQVAPADTTKVEKKPAEPAFKYEPPTVGLGGVVLADTLFYTGTNKPSRIGYFDKDNRLVHEAEYAENGELESYRTCEDRDNWDKYNNKGENVGWNRKYSDGTVEYYKKEDNGRVHRYSFDLKGRIVEGYYSNNNDFSRNTTYSYNPDGTRTETISINGGQEYKEVFDKNDRLIKKKEYNADGTLKHTIIPKYNKEGDIIKRDTIPNK